MSPLSPRLLPEGTPAGCTQMLRMQTLGVNPLRAVGINQRQESSWRDLSTALKPRQSHGGTAESGQGWGWLAPVALPQDFQGKKGCPKEQAVLRPRLQWRSSAQGNWSLKPSQCPLDVLWPKVGLAMAQCGSEGQHSSRRSVPNGCSGFTCLHTTSRTLSAPGVGKGLDTHNPAPHECCNVHRHHLLFLHQHHPPTRMHLASVPTRHGHLPGTQGNPAWLLTHRLHMFTSLLSCLGAARAQAGGTN